MTEVRITPVSDFSVLAARWRALEARADGSFFQSWTWVGCLAAERYTDPMLVEAVENGRTVALGLFNRVRRRMGPDRWYLHETGDPATDCPYIEQNGFLAETGRAAELSALCLRALLRRHEVMLSGADPQTAAVAGGLAGLAVTLREQDSPVLDLCAVRRRGGDFLAGRSANTRRQIRQSDRYYGAWGTLSTRRAGTVAEAWAMLEQMAEMHQAVWAARGMPGSFARPFFRRFHRCLIETGLERGEIVLLTIRAGETVVGVLYNFVWRGRMLAYQSGFAYQPGENRARPGLTCHHAAIRMALAEGCVAYDFLAGADRYKRSLADGAHRQFWLLAGPVWSPALAARRIAAGLAARPSVRCLRRRLEWSGQRGAGAELNGDDV